MLVSCGETPDQYNLITVAWTGTVCSDPPMCYISIRPERHSYPIIEKNREFVLNLVTKEMAAVTDWCGVRSGAKYNKFFETGLTPIKSQKVKAPLVYESPVNLECVVKEILHLGSHDMFLAEIVAVDVKSSLLNDKGVIRLDKAGLVCYSHGHYYELGKMLGKFGFSVKK